MLIAEDYIVRKDYAVNRDGYYYGIMVYSDHLKDGRIFSLFRPRRLEDRIAMANAVKDLRRQAKAWLKKAQESRLLNG